MLNSLPCPVCNAESTALDVVDFNKSCEEVRAKFLPLSGTPVYYYLCSHCGFCFAPEFGAWSLQAFSEKIYNQQYIDIDPDYQKARPESNAANLTKLFAGKESSIQHLDFGGGNGLLSNLLRQSGWNSSSYDPFYNADTDIAKLGRFDFITAYEVFEHVPDVNELMSQLDSLLREDGLLLFSTLLSDGHIQRKQRLNWWYASPRNGHISLFSKASLGLLARRYGLQFGSFNSGVHVLFRQIPDWAAHLFKPR